MQTAVADLYQHIFLFLGDVMDWIMGKRRQRLLDFFENFKDLYDVKMKTIQKKTDQIRDIANHLHKRGTKNIQDSTMAVKDWIDHLMSTMDRDRRLDRDDVCSTNNPLCTAGT